MDNQSGCLAVVVALREEAQAVQRAGEWRRVASADTDAVYEGTLGGHGTVLAVGGVGRGPAEAATLEVIDRFRPSAVLSLGVAGGLDPTLRPGHLVAGEGLLALEGEWEADAPFRLAGRLEADRGLLRRALWVLREAGLRHSAGACLTVPRAVVDPRGKEALWRLTGAMAVEMESFWTGSICRERGVPFLAVRAVLDPQGEPVPPYVGSLAGKRGRLPRLASALARPWRLPRLVGLAGGLAAAQRSIGAFAGALAACYHAEDGSPGLLSGPAGTRDGQGWP